MTDDLMINPRFRLEVLLHELRVEAAELKREIDRAQNTAFGVDSNYQEAKELLEGSELVRRHLVAMSGQPRHSTDLEDVLALFRRMILPETDSYMGIVGTAEEAFSSILNVFEGVDLRTFMSQPPAPSNAVRQS